MIHPPQAARGSIWENGREALRRYFAKLVKFAKGDVQFYSPPVESEPDSDEHLALLLEWLGDAALAVPRLGLAALSAWLLLRAFPPISEPWCVLVAFVPMLWAVTGISIAAAFVIGWFGGLIACASAFSWAAPAMVRFHQLPVYEGALGFALLVAWQALPFALFAAGATVVHRGAIISKPAEMEISSGWVLAAWWVVLESSFPQVLPWHLGNVFAAEPYLRQSADLFGTYGLSYFAILINVWTYNIIFGGLPRWRRVRLSALGAVLIGIVALYGWTRLTLGSGRGERPTSVAVVQTAVQTDGLSAEAATELAWREYEQATLLAAESWDQAEGGPPAVVIWPESLLRIDLPADVDYAARIERLVQRIGRPLLLGALMRAPDSEAELNAAFVFNPGPVVLPSFFGDLSYHAVQIYEKQRLLRFAEYLPAFSSWLPIQGWRTSGHFVGGDRTGAMWLADGMSMATAICLEATEPGVYNAKMIEGANILVNLSDDGWFNDPLEAQQHLNAVAMRAIEGRRWMVRASNSGISAFIDPNGNVAAALPLGGTGVLHHRVATRETPTMFLLCGNLLIAVCYFNLFWYFLRVRAESYHARCEWEWYEYGRTPWGTYIEQVKRSYKHDDYP